MSDSDMETCQNCGTVTEPELCLECGETLCTPCSDTPHGLCKECLEIVGEDE